MSVEIRAVAPGEMDALRDLFREYEKAIGVSLCFQSFDAEVACLPGSCAPPEGRLLVAAESGKLAGCVALRKIGEGVAEMKRLYVRPGYRGAGLGRRLTDALIEEARSIGYRLLRLDTLATMKEAQALYVSMGFVDIPAYNEHPIEGTRFMEKKL